MKFYVKKHHFDYANYPDLRIAHISDLHFNSKIERDLLFAIVKEISENNPQMICFIGDLIDQGILTNDKYVTKAITLWLGLLGNIAPVYIIRGNHDSLTKTSNGWQYYNTDSFFENLQNIPSVTVLRNRAIKQDSISIIGIDTEEQTELFYEKIKNHLIVLTNLLILT